MTRTEHLPRLGNIRLAEAGADECFEAYGVTEPDLIGEAAYAYGDINADGTMN